MLVSSFIWFIDTDEKKPQIDLALFYDPFPVFIINHLKFGMAAFSQGVKFGGQQAQGGMKDQLLGFWKSEYRATWGVAANELTWLVRHANISGWILVNAAGGIAIQHNLSDVFDLRPGAASRGFYNDVTYYLGAGLHDILGASEPKVNASWRSVY